MAIDTLLFDLGGVIIDLHMERTTRAFEQLGLNPEGWFVLKDQQEVLNRYEKGELDADGFLQEINGHFGLQLTMNQLMEAWNALLGDIPSSRIALLRDLRKNYRLLALSNINTLHSDACHRILHQTHGISSFHELFDEVYFSYEIGQRKPDKASFLRVQELSGLVPAHTLFMDDGQANVETARQLGYHTLLINEDISHLLPAFLSLSS